MMRLCLCFGLAAVGCTALAGFQLLPEWSLGDCARQVLPLVQGRPWLYWLPGYTALAALVVQVTLPLVFPGLASRATFWTSRELFVLLTVTTVLLLRWPGLAHGQFNVDESATITGALTLLDDPRYWISIDGGTHGPLVELALLPVRLFGMQLEYGSARLVGLGLMLGCLFFLFGTLRTFFPEPISRAAVTPATICVAFQTHSDYLACNAEYPAIFLLCAGAYGCARLATGPAEGVYWRALASGFVLGLVPFAKLQAVPPGLVLATVAFLCLAVRFRGQGRKQLAACLALGAGGLIPAALVVLYVCYQGLFSHFWICYIATNLAYSDRLELGTYAKYQLFRGWAQNFPSEELFFRYFRYIIGAGLLVVGLRHLDSRCWRILLAGGAVLVASMYSVMAPGNCFNHYMLFLVFPFAFLAAFVLAMFHETQLGRVGRLALVFGFLAWAVYIPTSRALSSGGVPVVFASDLTPYDRHVTELIRRYAAPGEKLAVWGWVPKYHVLTGMRQSTLHNNTWAEMESKGNPYRDYFYRLYVQQLEQAKPPVFVDAVGPTLAYRDRDQFAHEKFPELREQIATHYELAGEVYGTRVYVSKERLAELSVQAPLLSEVPFPVVPVATNRVRWNGGAAECLGEDSHLVFALKQPEFIQGIRLRFSYEGAADGPIEFQTYWGEASRHPFTKQERFTSLKLKAEKKPMTLTIPVNDTIDAFRIDPDSKPCTFKLEEIVLLVRPGEQDRLVKEYAN